MLLENKHAGGFIGGYRRIPNLKDDWKSLHVLYNRPYTIILTV